LGTFQVNLQLRNALSLSWGNAGSLTSLKETSSASLVTTSHSINLQISASSFFFSLTDVLNIHKHGNQSGIIAFIMSSPLVASVYSARQAPKPQRLTRGRSLTSLVPIERLHTYAFLPSFFVMDRVAGLASFFA
jgi:hypothetical protein